MTDGPIHTKGEEGLRLAVYDDATGDVLVAGDVPQGTATQGYGCTGPDIYPGCADWTTARADAEFLAKYVTALADAVSLLGGDAWTAIGDGHAGTLDDMSDRQVALADMSYNLGLTRLSKFTKMLDALRTGNWAAARDQVLLGADGVSPSRYATQAPNRARRNAAAFATGSYP